MRNGNIPGYADYVDGELDIFADISTRYVSDIQCMIQRAMIKNNKVHERLSCHIVQFFH